MAVLERTGTKIRCHLLARHIVGRSSVAHLRLPDPSVSGEHAVISWNGRRWEVHDLGSRNGTTVDGRRLGQGERAELARGVALRFGSSASPWSLADDGPPVVIAVPEGGGEPIAESWISSRYRAATSRRSPCTATPRTAGCSIATARSSR